MSMQNSDRRDHGQSASNGLAAMLDQFLDNKYLVKITANYHVGRPGYSDTEQFYAAYIIEFSEGNKWILYSTTSLRDRFKAPLWDAFNIKEIDPSIKKAYLIYPDGLPTVIQKPFIRKQLAIVNKEGFYSIDGVLSQSEFYNLVENEVLSSASAGSRNGILGNKFEDRVAALLSYAENLNKWKTNAATSEGMQYDLFKKIIDCFELPIENTKSISATSDKKIIGKLPTGGNPKTDVLVTVTLEDDTEVTYTISCKRSSADDVSVHDYTATQFADVLDNDNQELRTLLEGFQAAGSLSGFGSDNCARLERVIAPYVEKLSKWVLGGQEGYGDPEKQWADYILTYDPCDNSSAIHRIEEYVSLLLNEEHERNFGTPFGWTYPSKRRGERIQLKSKIIK